MCLVALLCHHHSFVRSFVCTFMYFVVQSDFVDFTWQDKAVRKKGSGFTYLKPLLSGLVIFLGFMHLYDSAHIKNWDSPKRKTRSSTRTLSSTPESPKKKLQSTISSPCHRLAIENHHHQQQQKQKQKQKIVVALPPLLFFCSLFLRFGLSR